MTIVDTDASDLFGQANDLEGEAAELQAEGESTLHQATQFRLRAKALRKEANTRDQTSWANLFKSEAKKELTDEQFAAIIAKVRNIRAGGTDR